MNNKKPIVNKCKDLNLDGFITCLCDEDYSPLGDYGPDELAVAWQAIRSEYISLMEDMALIQAEAYRTEILYWTLQYKVVISSVELLGKWADPAVIATLKEMGYYYEYDRNNPEQYLKDLERTAAQSKSILVQIKNLEHELQTLTAEMGKDHRPITRQDMINNIAVFSKYMGYSIDLKTTMVDTYVAIRNLYYKELNTLKNGGSKNK